MIFHTESGSVYEVNDHKIRRLAGNKPATIRQGVDGNWRLYERLSPVTIGEPVLVEWPKGTPLLPGSPPDAIPCTTTSAVTFIDLDMDD